MCQRDRRPTTFSKLSNLSPFPISRLQFSPELSIKILLANAVEHPFFPKFARRANSFPQILSLNSHNSPPNPNLTSRILIAITTIWDFLGKNNLLSRNSTALRLLFRYSYRICPLLKGFSLLGKRISRVDRRETFWPIVRLRRHVAFTAHNNRVPHRVFTRVPPSPSLAGNGGGACLLVQVMADWLSAARFPRRRFPFRFFSSAVSSLSPLSHEETVLAHPPEHMSDDEQWAAPKRTALEKPTNRKDRASAIRQTLVELIHIVRIRVWDGDGKGDALEMRIMRITYV